MRYPFEIQLYQSHALYPVAKDILTYILEQTIPPDELLLRLYPVEKLASIQRNLDWGYEHLFNNLDAHQIRTHRKDAPTSISDARLQNELDERYRRIHGKLLHSLLPRSEELEPFYGDFTSYVLKSFSSFIELNLRRKCGISSTAHHNRIGCAINRMGFDMEHAGKYPVIGVLHDTIEDLFYRVRDHQGILYGFERYDEFVDSYIPKPVQREVKMLTNHYDLILNYAGDVITRRDKTLSKEHLIEIINEVASSREETLSVCAGQMLDHLTPVQFEESTLLTDAKWFCYRDLYLHNLAVNSQKADDYRPLEIKAIDLSDNGHGKESLPHESRIKNIIKQISWADAAYKLKSNWTPLNSRVMEIAEDALVAAEHLIIKDLLSLESVQDFFVAALQNVKKLVPVFYTRNQNIT